jgi:hypothetical protein
LIMERYQLHIDLGENILVYSYQVPSEPFETIIRDAREHQRDGRTVVLYRETVENGCGWVILERVLTFT